MSMARCIETNYKSLKHKRFCTPVDSREEQTANSPELLVGKSTIEGGSSFVAAATSFRSIQDVRAAYHKFLSKPGILAAARNLGLTDCTHPIPQRQKKAGKMMGIMVQGKSCLTYFTDRTAQTQLFSSAKELIDLTWDHGIRK